MTAEIDRQPRVRFKYPVRVVPLTGQPRAWRTLSANISKKGMFLRMPEPLENGTKVALSFEADGQVLPFAKAEVVWKRMQQSKFPDRNTGFGVRFTEYLHPRAEELVGYLCENLDTGRPLKPAKRKLPSLKTLGAVALAFVLGFGGIALWHAFSAPTAPDEVSDVNEITEESAAPAMEVAAVPAAVEAAPAPVAMAEVKIEAAPVAPAAEQKVAEVKVEAAPAPAAKVEDELVPLAAPVDAKVEAKPEVVAEAKVAEKIEPKVEAAPAEKGGDAASLTHGSVSLPSGAAARLAWKMDGLTAHFELIGKPGSKVTKVFAMHNPERLVFDIEGAKPKKSRTVKTGVAHLAQVRVGARKDATRLVLDFADAPSKIDATGTSANVEFATK